MCLLRSCFFLTKWQLRQRHIPPPSQAIRTSALPVNLNLGSLWWISHHWQELFMLVVRKWLLHFHSAQGYIIKIWGVTRSIQLTKSYNLHNSSVTAQHISLVSHHLGGYPSPLTSLFIGPNTYRKSLTQSYSSKAFIKAMSLSPVVIKAQIGFVVPFAHFTSPPFRAMVCQML